MARSQLFARSLNDVGLAAWFGGTLMGAVGLNEAAAGAAPAQETTRVASAGWSTWTPVNAAAIAAHLVGSTMLAAGNKGRVAAQGGVASVSAVKLGFTVAALAVTGYSRVLGKRVEADQSLPAATATSPIGDSGSSTAKAEQQLRLLQWAVPALTGAMLVCDAILGEQQRPMRVLAGVLHR